jgi:hypothetical protein
MTSSSRTKTNQKNAQKSTGPRSIEGRKRSSKNALKHGLSKGQNLDPDHVLKIEFLTRKLCEGRDDQCMELARQLAQAQIQLNYIRSLKLACFKSNLTKPLKAYEAKANQNLKQGKGDLGLSNQIDNDQEPSGYLFDDFDELKPCSIPHNITGCIETRLHEFRKLDRYENIAMRRLKMAIERYIVNNC